jgi:hypothetical protein
MMNIGFKKETLRFQSYLLGILIANLSKFEFLRRFAVRLVLLKLIYSTSIMMITSFLSRQVVIASSDVCCLIFTHSGHISGLSSAVTTLGDSEVDKLLLTSFFLPSRDPCHPPLVICLSSVLSAPNKGLVTNQ